MGMMFALAIVLSIFEHSLPPLPFLPPNFKFGLSNIIIMYCVFFMGKMEGILLNILKSGFILMTRGAAAGILSLCGGLFAVIVLICLISIFKDRISYVMASICGAIAHNIGQILAACFIVGTNILIYYLPVLLVMGIVMGTLTGLLLKVVMPALRNLKF